MRVDPYLVGILFGDGSTSRRKDGAYAVWLDQTERNRPIIENTTPKLQQLGCKVHSYRYYAKSDKVWKYRALVYSKELYQDLRRKFSDITAYVNTLSDDEAKSFIAGVMDAEGTVTDRVVIYNEDIELLAAIQRRLELLGVKHAHIYKYGTIHTRSADLQTRVAPEVQGHDSISQANLKVRKPIIWLEEAPAELKNTVNRKPERVCTVYESWPVQVPKTWAQLG